MLYRIGISVIINAFIVTASLAKPLAERHLLKITDLPENERHAKPNTYANYVDGLRNRAKSKVNYTINDQNNFVETGNPLDVAIVNPDCYLITETPHPYDLVYSRLGSFEVNKDGLLLNKYGFRLIGADEDGVTTVIQFPSYILTTKQTNTVTIDANIQHSNGNLSDSFNAYDPVGREQPVNFTITPVQPNIYLVKIFNSDRSVEYAKGILSFDGQGKYNDLEGLNDVMVPSMDNSTDPIHIKFYLFKMTNYEQPTILKSVTQDGYPTEEFRWFSILRDGEIQAHYSDGIDVIVGTILTTKQNKINLVPYEPYFRVWNNPYLNNKIPHHDLHCGLLQGYLNKDEIQR